jgi:transmembrane sensor
MSTGPLSPINDLAAEWVVRDDRGLSDQERRERDEWLAANDRHLGAYVRATAIFMRTERALALGPGFDGAMFGGTSDQAPVGEADADAAGLSRRRLVKMGLAASVTAVIGAGAVGWWTSRGTRFGTRLGEIHTIALDDGSTVTLNTRSSIRVAFSERLRTIDLEFGEALFNVAKDASRPFVVRGGAIDVTAVGTSFTVSRDAERAVARVVVNEGIVEARAPAAVDDPPLRLTANMAASGNGGEMLAPEALSLAEVERELVWREGRLQFVDATLEQAAADFARYSEIVIQIDDPVLRQERISGSFIATDPVGFSRAAAQIFGARTEVSADQVRLLR